ncbi:MAG: hypothetical protein JST00_15695 [Deltaproteobacteria bacterium]|nr:hypothetical protein [Deltaproteobacteria bacterium]
MRARAFVALLAISLSAPSVAAAHGADTLQATRFELVERAHTIDVRVDRGLATLVVRRTVANRGPKSDQATFFVAIPQTAVATRLRTSGVDAQGRTVWFEGELMEAEAAAKKYQELTGIGGYYPKDPALLSWRERGLLALQVFPVPGQSTKTVEYTLEMPLEYKDGAYHLELPPFGTEELRASMTVTAAHGEDALTVNGVVPAPAPRTISADRPLALELRPRNVPKVDGALASVPVAEGKHLVRARIAAAPRLSEVPRGAHVVVLFDNSRSMVDAPAGLVAVRSYLGHMTGATVDFLTFDRQVASPIGRGVSVADALTRLSTIVLEPKNGSRLDDALAKADAILQTSPALARRVIIVTDTRMRSELSADKVARSSWKSGALVHLATVEDGAPSALRDDDSEWAGLPRRTGGLFWHAHAPSALEPTTRVVFEEWARPKRIDKLVVRGLPEEVSVSPVLDEGQAIEDFRVAITGSPRVDIQGELWSTPLRATHVATDAEAKVASALVFGSDLFHELSEAEQMVLAMRGGAVSPVTSYLAIEPGVRPSTEGLDWGGVGHGEGVGTGQGFGMGHGSMGGTRHTPRFDKQAFLRRELEAAARHCAVVPTGGTRGIKTSLETTTIELVDIRTLETTPVRDAKVESCVREEMWNVALPADFEAEHDAFDVSITL